MVSLLLSNSSDATADYIEERYPVKRYDTDLDLETTEFLFDGATSVMRWRGTEVAPEDIDLVILRRPKPFRPNVSNDSFQNAHIANEWAEAFEGFLAQIPTEKWMNHPATNYRASHKLDQLARARKCGLLVPNTTVTNRKSSAELFFHDNCGDLIVKPIATGYIERESEENDTQIYTSGFASEHLHLLDRIASCPVLFQERIRKSHDVRITIVDHAMVAVALFADENGYQRLDIRRNSMEDVRYEIVAVPEDTATSIRLLMAEYELRFAAIDFAVDQSGNWFFLEVNPNGQWAWLDLFAGTDIIGLFPGGTK